MSEEDDGSSLRETVVKRPDASSVPVSLTESLKLPSSCHGVLEKLATSLFAQWQARYWELRGHYLVYFKDAANSTNGSAPLGAIDIRNFQNTAVMGSTLVLTSKSREFKLRVPEARGQPRQTSVFEWQLIIDEKREEYRETADELEKRKLGGKRNTFLTLKADGTAGTEEEELVVDAIVEEEDDEDVVEAFNEAASPVTLKAESAVILYYWPGFVGRTLAIRLMLEVPPPRLPTNDTQQRSCRLICFEIHR